MRLISLRVSVIIGIVLLVALLTSAVFYLTAIRFHHLMEGSLAAQQSVRTDIAAQMWGYGSSTSKIAGLWLEDSTTQQLTFHALDGRIEKYSKDGYSQSLEKVKSFPHDFEHLSDSVSELGTAEGILHLDGHHLIASAVGDSGRIEVVFSTETINFAVAKLVHTSHWFLTGIVLLTGLGVFLIDRRLSRTLNRMISTANSIASGGQGLKLDIKTGDKLEELGEGFNRLAASLALQRKAIDRDQKELSAIIAARTAELSDERDRLSRILDNLPSAFILFDNDLNITAASSAVERLTGVIPAIGGSHTCICPQVLEDGEGCVVNLARKRGTAITRRQFQTWTGGEQKTLEHSVFPVHADTQIVGWLETITDVTEQVQQYEKLIRAERLSAAGQTAAIVAHEVRNLLTSAKMLLQMDMEASNLTEDQKENVTVAVDSIINIERKIEELLAFTKPSPPMKEIIKINELVSLVSNQVKPIAEDAKVKLELVNLVEEVEVSLDIEKTRQALVNLLLNAIQAAGEGGVARFTVGGIYQTDPSKSSPAIESSFLERVDSSTGYLQFTVDDTGSGVPENIRQQVFNPFFTTRARGTGLGLATVSQIVKSFGGSISIEESTLGGAQFIMIIPV